MREVEEGRRASGVVRSVVVMAALTVDELLDGTEGATIPVAPWRRRCRRLVRRVVAEY